MGTQSQEVVIIRARGADFQAGGLMRTCKHEQTGGVQGHAPLENFKFKSSEMAINASKTANSNINL